MTPILRFILSIFVVTLASSAYSRQSHQTDRSSILEQTVREEMAASGSPAAVLAVFRDDSVLFERAIGTANLITKATVDHESMFAIGSVTKFFTALALLTALEQHELDEHATVGSIVTGLSPKLSALTISSLLSHTSGMLDDWPNTNEHRDDVFELFRKAGDDVLFADQGKVFSYSNRAYALAGLVLSHLMKLSFTEAIDSLIVRPLNLQHTTCDVQEVMIRSFAAGHTKNPTTGLVAPSTFAYVTDPIVQPAGGVFSNVSDLSKLGKCFINDGVIDGRRVFRSRTLRIMSQSMVPINALHAYLAYPVSSYGYGSILFERNGSRFIGNAGETGNSNALFLLAPESRTVVVALSNTGGHPFIRSVEKAVELFIPGKVVEAIWPPERQETLLGKYFAPNIDKSTSSIAEIFAKESNLFLKMPNGREYPLKRIGELTYEFNNPAFTIPMEIAFYRDSMGKIAYLNYRWRTRVKLQ